MKLKLNQGMAGGGEGVGGFSFRPHQVIECSDATGARLVQDGVGKEVDDSVPHDGVLHDELPSEGSPAPRRAQPETATKAAPEAAVTRGGPARCKGTTTQGNPCMKAPLAGQEFCARHQDQGA